MVKDLSISQQNFVFFGAAVVQAGNVFGHEHGAYPRHGAGGGSVTLEYLRPSVG